MLAVEKVDVASFESVSYIKKINGKVLRGEGQNFAFVRAEGGNCYVAPDNVKKYALENKEQVSAVAALTYNKKKDDQCRKIAHPIHSHFIDNIYM